MTTRTPISKNKCWRDGNKISQNTRWQNHKWKWVQWIELRTTKHVTQTKMREVEWALSDKDNTFTELSLTDPNSGGLLYSKHGNEHINQDYCQKSLRWNGSLLTQKQMDGGMVWMAKTCRCTYFECLGGTDLTDAETSALLAKFAYLIGAKAEQGRGMMKVNKHIKAIRQRCEHRSTVWLVLHRAGIHEKNIHKTIFQDAGLF